MGDLNSVAPAPIPPIPRVRCSACAEKNVGPPQARKYGPRPGPQSALLACQNPKTVLQTDRSGPKGCNCHGNRPGGWGCTFLFQIKWDLDRVLRIFLLGVPRGRAEKKSAPPPLETDLGSRFFWEGAPSQGPGPKNRPCHRRRPIEGYSTLEGSATNLP